MLTVRVARTKEQRTLKVPPSRASSKISISVFRCCGYQTFSSPKMHFFLDVGEIRLHRYSTNRDARHPCDQSGAGGCPTKYHCCKQHPPQFFHKAHPGHLNSTAVLAEVPFKNFVLRVVGGGAGNSSTYYRGLGTRCFRSSTRACCVRGRPHGSLFLGQRLVKNMAFIQTTFYPGVFAPPTC